YWVEVIPLRASQLCWTTALDVLEHRRCSGEGSLGLMNTTYEKLCNLCWSGLLQGFSIQIEKHYLSTFFTTDWLSNEHLDLFLDLTRTEIASSPLRDTILLPNESALFIPKIQQAYLRQDQYPTTEFRWLHRIATKLTTGTQTLLGTFANINGNHWVTIVIDTERKVIFHGNSMGDSIDRQLSVVLQWWTSHHFGVRFRISCMSIARQNDSHSCGMLAWGALEHCLLNKPDRLMEGQDMRDCRLEVFLRVINQHNS
ncbi:hypothetical protein K435DRAFT_582997, partial [Dendrothele bispora CBS 962.96]